MGNCNCIEAYQLSDCTLENTPWYTLDGQSKPMKIVDVYDADTVTVAFKWNGKKYLKKMRLLGIDSAELHPRKNVDHRETEMKHAQLGKDRMTELCLGKIVQVDCGGWDKYGRLLGTIHHNSKNINELLIEEGLACKYDGKKKLKFVEWYNQKRFGKLEY